MAFGTGEYRYQVVEGWGRGAEGCEFGGVLPGVAVDSQDRVYLARRKPPAILVYERAGHYLGSIGEGQLRSPHGMCVSAEDHVWVTDVILHAVFEFDTMGALLTTLGTPGEPGAPGMPFNKPTKVAVGPSGNVYVSDGYGQHRIHRFRPDGILLNSWGQEGNGPGEFALPHSVALDSHERVFVPDRSNHRIQVFNADGEFLREWSGAEWPGLQWPNEICFDRQGIMYVVEAAHRLSIWRYDEEPKPTPVIVPATSMQLLARWGDLGLRPGQFADCPHSIAVDSLGDLYIGEVPNIENRLQKFERIPK